MIEYQTGPSTYKRKGERKKRKEEKVLGSNMQEANPNPPPFLNVHNLPSPPSLSSKSPQSSPHHMASETEGFLTNCGAKNELNTMV